MLDTRFRSGPNAPGLAHGGISTTSHNMHVRSPFGGNGRRRRPMIPRPWLRDRTQASNNSHGSGPTISTNDNNHSTSFLWDKPKRAVSWKKLASCFFCFGDVKKSTPTDSTIGRARTEIRAALAISSFDSCCSRSNSSSTDDDLDSLSTASDDSYSSYGCSDISVDDTQDEAEPQMLLRNHHRFSHVNIIGERRSSKDGPRRMSFDAQIASPTQSPAAAMTPKKRRSDADSSTTARHRRSFQLHLSTRSAEKMVDITPPPPLLVLCDNNDAFNRDLDGSSNIDEISHIASPSKRPRTSHMRQRSRHIGCMDQIEDRENRRDSHNDMNVINQYENPAMDSPNRRTQQQPRADVPPSCAIFNHNDNHNRQQRPANSQEELPPKHPPITAIAFDTSRRETRPDAGAEFVPDYMRKNSFVDEIDSHRIIVSGWVACSPQDGSLLDKLKARRKISSQDIHYIRVVDHASNGLLFQVYDSQLMLCTEFEPAPGWRCEKHCVSSQMGQCIVLRDGADQIVCTILPVSLGNSFFTAEGCLIPPKDFNRIRSLLFAHGGADEKSYAPNEQHDAVFFIMFALDCVLRNLCR